MFNKCLLFSAIVLVAAACNQKKTKTGSNPAVAAVTDTVPVFILSSTELNKSIELPAELQPYETAALTPKVEGYVKQMRVDIGDRVRKGQVLVVLDAPELMARSAEFQTAISTARSKYMASKDVYDRLYKAAQAKTAGIVAPVDLEKSRNQQLADSAAYESAKSLARSYHQVAGYLTITAPFSGIITARTADPGALVSQATPVLTIQNTDVLRLRVAVPELYVSTGATTKTVSFRVQSNPNKSFAATLSRKSGAIDPQNRTETWEYRYLNAGNELKAGSFAYVRLDLERSLPSFVVAPSVVATNQERKFVIVVKNGVAEWVDVRPGMSNEKGIEIFGNLTNGDTLVQRATDERKAGTSAYWKLAK
ncbi:efflux RND transporter periplasmic adaptor subunit [Niabella hirudinis]|uniref:efflux RND transporter periplasmic adaptor subunit n=1 Tax=Niabella hirudinis TaxID=1285929 RepID=UPI003EBAA915